MKVIAVLSWTDVTVAVVVAVVLVGCCECPRYGAWLLVLCGACCFPPPSSLMSIVHEVEIEVEVGYSALAHKNKFAEMRNSGEKEKRGVTCYMILLRLD